MKKQSIFRIPLIITLIFLLTAMNLNAEICEGIDYEKWNDCQGSFKWEDGAQYSGHWKNGNLNGYGAYIFADDNV